MLRDVGRALKVWTREHEDHQRRAIAEAQRKGAAAKEARMSMRRSTGASEGAAVRGSDVSLGLGDGSGDAGVGVAGHHVQGPISSSSDDDGAEAPAAVGKSGVDDAGARDGDEGCVMETRAISGAAAATKARNDDGDDGDDDDDDDGDDDGDDGDDDDDDDGSKLHAAHHPHSQGGVTFRPSVVRLDVDTGSSQDQPSPDTASDSSNSGSSARVAEAAVVDTQKQQQLQQQQQVGAQERTISFEIDPALAVET